MKRLLILLLMTFPVIIAAQNVGIGTTTPVYKLQLHNTAAPNNFMNITHTGTGISVSDGLVMGINGSDAVLVNMENGDLVLGTNNLTRMTIDNTGNVGIGITTPTAKLDINGTVKLEGLNLFEFGAGVAGKEVNAGKVGYNAFGTNALAFVGAGTTSANRAVYFFAEGGTTFSGPALVTGNLNLAGQLQVNGTPGSSGQVLTSNGTSDPTWTDAAYNDNTRFAVVISQDPGSTSGDLRMLSTLYNLNAANVTINPASITINKTGLYHFDISMISQLNYSVAPSFYPRHELWFDFGPVFTLKPIYKVMDQAGPGTLNWWGNEKVSVEVHITAPVTLTFFHRLGVGSGGTVLNYNIEGFITGHLIND